MSDEKFEQDLRSMLLDDAPRDVPDDLRRQVADIPATHPLTGRVRRPGRLGAVPLWIGGLAAAALVIAIGIWRFGPLLSTDAGGSASPLPTVGPSATASNVAVASPSAAVVACVSADLDARIQAWQGAAGSRIADVELTNTSGATCFVRGTPGLQLVDAQGTVLLHSATSGPSGQPNVKPNDPTFAVAPGGKLRTEVQASNYCGPEPALPIDIVFTLPADGGRVTAKAGPGVSSAEAVPPCNGPVAGSISMNGWKP